MISFHLPIVRSFAMACLFTVAVLAGRRPVSLRGLALAATVLMLLEPEEVPGVSFQMSFSAVLALISGYELLRPALRSVHGDGTWKRRFALHLAALALTSALAGTASAPFGAYHFGRIQVYFVVANMVAVPLTAVWAMPAGLIGLVLMPFRLDWLAFIPMGWGVQAILWVARTTAALPAATLDVPHMPPWGLLVTAFGIAWLGLWRSPMRLVGVPLIALGLASPMLTRPPDLMISADARLIAVRAHGEVFLQQASGASKFTREAWLQYWAAGTPHAMPGDGSASDGAISCQKDACMLRPWPLAKAALLVRGALHPEGCGEASVIVSAEPARGLCPKPWPALVDRFTVWRYGAVAVWLNDRHAYVLTDRAYRGFRPWVPPPPEPRARQMPALPIAKTDSEPDTARPALE
jgi:competence protein ComEC